LFSPEDHLYMSRAIQLARKGRFTTSPNPNVGCVIVNDQQIVGEGFHFRAGEPHAEVHALRMAREKAKGATAYVTLEPCSHFGRTPPCADALINAGVSRVVAAMEDPNPQVSGRGLKRIADAGISVQSGLMQQEAEALNPGFIKRMKTGLPFVRLKLAASLDGKTALANGQSQWITGSEARADVQRYRAMSSAILTGADTVLVDNPSLNVRWAQLPESIRAVYREDDLRQPVRIVLDSRHRLLPDAHLFSLTGDIWLVHGETTDMAGFQSNTKEILSPLKDNKIDLNELMKTLGLQNVNDLWVEAGATLAGAMIQASLVDELIVYVAPKLMGNLSRGLLNMPEFTAMEQVESWHWHDIRKVGNDLRLTLRP